ncbi:protein of unknown function [Candidatus Filomicrobium marinum]|uniref:Uncharacterized protein n=1 Tax=Candidatus Filomicrobium marinum TaxID=1608628 RepID=A0A0D6J973_9HYPH|nr:protein of unknown function [Candidatus Filomicrobium marinum]CPR14656.1 protein of unknown function [Candidatus Filomicrobium marinum]
MSQFLIPYIVTDFAINALLARLHQIHHVSDAAETLVPIHITRSFHIHFRPTPTTRPTFDTRPRIGDYQGHRGSQQPLRLTKGFDF